MKIIRTVVGLLFLTVFWAGCGSPVYVQRDQSANLAKYKTFMWVETRESETDNKNTLSFADQAIHRQVNTELEKRGWKEVSSSPEVLIGHDILVEKSIQRQSEPVYSQPFSRVYYNPWTRRWGTIYYPSQFMGYDNYDTPVREGTVTISIMDAQTDKTLWQAWTTQQINHRMITDPEIAKAVKNIFKKLNTSM